MEIVIPDTCVGCGQCCDIPDGDRCKDLDCSLNCAIYATRPQVCQDFVRGSAQCIKALKMNRFKTC